MTLASLQSSRRQRRAWELDRDLVAELAGSPRASLPARLLARYELSRFGLVSPLMSVALIAPTWLLVILSVGAHNAILLTATLVWIAIGLLALISEMTRAVWLARHPLASRRSLHAVAVVVGPEMITTVLRRLATHHRSDPDYAIRREDVTLWVKHMRRERRAVAKRAGGVRLAHDLPPA